MGTEPVAISSAIKEALSSILKVVVVLGIIQLTTEQFGMLMIAVDSILALVLLVWQARSKATSLAHPRVPAGTVVTSYDPATGADIGSTVAPTQPVPTPADMPPAPPEG